MKRYDAAVTAAILLANAGDALPRTSVGDVSNGGLALSDFHADLPAGFQSHLDAVVGTLRSGPPRSSSAPPSASPPTGA